MAIEQETPVEAVDVELQVLAAGEALHEDAEEAVVRPLLECQALAVVHVQYEFLRAALAELFRLYPTFDLRNRVERLLDGAALNGAPGQAPDEEVDHHVPQGLEVVPAGQLIAVVGVHGCETRGSNYRFIARKFDVAVLFILVEIAFGKAEIYHVDGSRAAFQTHQEIVGLDVSVEHGLPAGLVEHLEAVNELYEEQDGGLEAELLAANGVEVSKRRAEQF